MYVSKEDFDYVYRPPKGRLLKPVPHCASNETPINPPLPVSALIDSGNRSQFLIREDIFLQMLSKRHIERAPANLTTAQKGGQLKISGQSKVPVTIVLTDGVRKFSYKVRPLIASNLSLPALFSLQDLRNLNASIDLIMDELIISKRNFSLKVPLSEYQGCKVHSLHCAADVTIQPKEEVILYARADGALVNSILECEPSPLLAEEGLQSCPTVDKVTSSGQVRVQFLNLSDHSFQFKKGQKIGIAGTRASSSLCGSVSADRTADMKRQQSRLPKATTKKEISQLIWEKLKFEDPNVSELSAEERRRLCDHLVELREALSLYDDEFGEVKGYEMDLDTGDSPPIRQHPRSVPPHLRGIVKDQLNVWLKSGRAEPSTSPWLSNLVVVKSRHSDKWRVAIDFSSVNATLKNVSRFVSSLEDSMQNLRPDPERPPAFFTTLDLTSAFMSMKLSEQSKPKTAFHTPYGHFQLAYAGFGLSSSPGNWFRIISDLQSGLIRKDPEMGRRLSVYFDDVCLTSWDFDDLCRQLTFVLQAFIQTGLKINLGKCLIAKKHLRWLGMNISPEGIRPDDSHLKILQDWPRPKTLKDLRAVSGFLVYFRRFLKNFSARTFHIRQLLSASQQKEGNTRVNVQWTEKEQAEFDDLKQSLLSKPLLQYPDFRPESEPFQLHVDGCRLGSGSTLTQVQRVRDPETGKTESRMCIIAFGSRRMTKSQSFQSSYKLELISVVSAVETFRHFLLGKPFIIWTDSKSLSWLMKTNSDKLPGVLSRYKELLSSYSFDIWFISGKENGASDGLSRRNYADGDLGNMVNPDNLKRAPDYDDEFIDPPIEDDPVIQDEARVREDDAFWLPLMATRQRRRRQLNAASVCPIANKPFVPIYEAHQTRARVKKNATTTTPLPSTTATKVSAPQPLLSPHRLAVGQNHRAPASPPPPPISSPPPSSASPSSASPPSSPPSFPDIRGEEEEIPPVNNEEDKEEDLGIDDDSEEEVPQKLRQMLQEGSLREAQERDPEAVRLKKLLKIHGSEVLGIRVREGIMQVLRKDHIFYRWLTMVPDSEVESVILLFHHDPVVGHLGIQRTVTEMSRFVYVPNLASRVAEFVNLCHCKDAKRLPAQHGPGMGATTSKAAERLKEWCMDIIHLPNSANGYRYILLFTDKATSFCEAAPLKRMTADLVSKAIEEHVILRYGSGLTFVNDGAQYFWPRRRNKCYVATDALHTPRLPITATALGRNDLIWLSFRIFAPLCSKCRTPRLTGPPISVSPWPR